MLSDTGLGTKYIDSEARSRQQSAARCHHISRQVHPTPTCSSSSLVKTFISNFIPSSPPASMVAAPPTRTTTMSLDEKAVSPPTQTPPASNDTSKSTAPEAERKARPERTATFQDYLVCLNPPRAGVLITDALLQRVFGYAKPWDFVAYAAGVLASIGAGITLPLMNVVFGEHDPSLHPLSRRQCLRRPSETSLHLLSRRSCLRRPSEKEADGHCPPGKFVGNFSAFSPQSEADRDKFRDMLSQLS